LLIEENSLVEVLGFDIGGANTKAAIVRVKNGKLESAKVAVEYFPVWKHPQELTALILRLKNQLVTDEIDALGVTMTAELSDIYATKREGVKQILYCVKQAFPKEQIYVLNTDARMVEYLSAKESPLSVVAANWAATGWLVSQSIKNCVVVDVGSTSASIIPIVNGKVVAKGKTDLDKLMCGELVYTGSLRTNVATIVHSIPIKDGISKVSSELFAQSGDAHLVLGNITRRQYTSETADGRGKTFAESLARLARVVCADTEMLTKKEILNLAQYIYDQQVLQVAEGLIKVYNYTKQLANDRVSVVITGLGKEFIAKKAAQQLGLTEIVDLANLIPSDAVVATPAFGVALMTAGKLEGEKIRWML
jgi:(4-(4-[2-(gamma-L-glutamylamino)ethyl]phenoxymethyl)furan-2-yl)methanamine synthase